MSDEQQQTAAGPAGTETTTAPTESSAIEKTRDEEAQGETPTAPPKSADELAAESELREALRMVVDPEINIDIVTLGLIREIEFRPGQGQVEVRMILTTPFCPYAGTLIQQVKDVTRQLSPLEPVVTLLEEPRWSPELMEGGDWSDWGLI